jgi:hypothetical protein
MAKFAMRPDAIETVTGDHKYDNFDLVISKSPSIPLFQRGRLKVPLFEKEGAGEIFG